MKVLTPVTSVNVAMNLAAPFLQPPAPVAAAATGRRKKVDLSGFSAQKPTGGRADYPAIPNTEENQVFQVADMVRKTRQQIAALNGNLQTLEYELRQTAKAYAFKTWAGREISKDKDKGFQVDVPGQEPVLMLTQERYTIVKGDNDKPIKAALFEERMLGVLGEELYDQLFKDGFTVKVEGDSIPVELHQAFIDGLRGLCLQLGLPESTIVAQPTVKHTSIFHTQRYKLLTPEQNAAVDELYPMVIQIKTEHKASK